MTPPRDDKQRFVPLGGSSRRYRNTHTGETISRRQYDQRFRLPHQGYRSYEEKAARRGQPRTSTTDRYFGVVRRLSSRQEPLGAAARAEGISPSTVWRFNEPRNIIGKRYAPGRPGRRARHVGYTITYQGVATFFTTDGALHRDVPLDARELSVVANYDNAIQRAKRTGDTRQLERYTGTVVYDVMGNQYALLTDSNALLALEAQEDLTDSYDQLIKSGEGIYAQAN